LEYIHGRFNILAAWSKLWLSLWVVISNLARIVFK
jgi:hypothetical protein